MAPLRSSRVLHPLVVILMLLGSAWRSHATSYSWNVASGDWFTPGNWDPAGVPGAADDASVSNGGTVTLNSAASVTNLALSNGVCGGTGSLDVSGTLAWSGGTLRGVVNADGLLSITGAASKMFAGTININSYALWTGTSKITYFNGQSTLNIAAGATFELQTDPNAALENTAGGFLAINNAGTIRRSAGAGAATIHGGFTNSGLIAVQVGTLFLSGGGTSTGAFDATGGKLQFDSIGGIWDLSPSATITGGDINISSTVNLAGTINVAGTTTVLGKLNLTGPGATLNAVSVTLGTLTVDTTTPSNAATLFVYHDSTRNGGGVLNVNGTLTWFGGLLAGVTNANGPLAIIPGTPKTLLGTLNINASATWTGTDTISYRSGTSTINVAGGAVFDIQNDVRLFAEKSTSILRLNNAGTLQKSAGIGTTTLGDGGGFTFDNWGITQIASGTLSVAGAYTQHAGATRLTGGSMQCPAGIALQGGSLDGFGALAASVDNPGGTVSPGLSIGELDEAGSYSQGTNGNLAVEIGGTIPGTDYDRMAISGTAALSGTLSVGLANGFEPNVGDTFTIMTFGSRTGDFAVVNGSSIPNDKHFEETITDTSVILTVLPGDDSTTTSTTTEASTTSTTTDTTSTSTTTTDTTSTSTTSTTTATDTTSTSTTTASTSSTTTTTTDTMSTSTTTESSTSTTTTTTDTMSTSTTTETTSTTTTTTLPGLGRVECYRVRDSRAPIRYALDLATGASGFATERGCSLKARANRICAEVVTQGTTPTPPGGGPAIPPISGSVFLSYKVKCPRQSVSPLVTLADEFGVGSFAVGFGSASRATIRELLIPAGPGPANGHFKCYASKDARPPAIYTMDLIAGVAGFQDQPWCTVPLAATEVCVPASEQNVSPAPPGGGPGASAGAGKAFLVYKLRCPRTRLQPMAFGDVFGMGTFVPGTAETLLTPAE